MPRVASSSARSVGFNTCGRRREGTASVVLASHVCNTFAKYGRANGAGVYQCISVLSCSCCLFPCRPTKACSTTPLMFLGFLVDPRGNHCSTHRPGGGGCGGHGVGMALPLAYVNVTTISGCSSFAEPQATCHGAMAGSTGALESLSCRCISFAFVGRPRQLCLQQF